MSAMRFVLRLDQPPCDDAIGRLFALASDMCVEVGAFRRWAAVHVDRDASSLAAAIVSAIRDLDAAGLVPIDVGPDEDLVSIPLIAERLGVAPGRVVVWAAGRHRSCGFPHPVDLPGYARCYLWSDIIPWAAERLGLAIPETDPTIAAANFSLRMRAIVPCVEDAAALVSLIGVEGRPVIRRRGRTRRLWRQERKRPIPPE